MSTILVIEDNDTMREGLLQVLSRMGHHAEGVNNGNSGLDVFGKGEIDLIICDLKMNEMNGMQVLEAIKKLDHDAVIIMMTAYGTIEVAVDAMKHGAFDFITKPFSPDVLRVKVEKALSMNRLARDHKRLVDYKEYMQSAEREAFNFKEIVGTSARIKEILDKVKRVAQTDSSVIVTGESGTGKELIARAIHYNSARKDGPFIKVNCGALAETLLETELFGHEKGAFTGALRRKMGRFELADGGTIFLDEIGDFSPAIQLKLLRVLQEREFERVGGMQTLKVNVRVISATNKDLQEEIRRGTFRSDLYYRLHIFPIAMPALRERREDIPKLAEHFLKLFNQKSGRAVFSMTKRAAEILQNYSWPGNIRELQNAIEQSVVMCDGDSLDAEHLPQYLRGDVAPSRQYLLEQGLPLNDVLEQVERELILQAFQKAGGVKTETARILGIKTSALYYKLEKYGIV